MSFCPWASPNKFDGPSLTRYPLTFPPMALSTQDLARAKAPRARRGTYFVQTWGCQMNEEDSEQIGLYLQQIGFQPARSAVEAQVIILNTCSVRRKPEDKAFSMLGELAFLKQRRAEIIVGVAGCMAQLRSEEIRQRAPFVDFVVGTGQIASIPGLVEEAAQTRKFRTRLELPERKGAVVTEIPQRLVSPRTEAELPFAPSPEPVAYDDGPNDLSRRVTERLSTRTAKQVVGGKLKAFIPIQYGCDKFCTFCIVPTTRGRERSRPTEDIVAEARALAEAGTKEITLLGQTVNSYGKNLAEGRVPFSKLLWLLAGIPGVERLRYTSPYPRDFKEDLIACIRDCPQVMEHVHLPLQSGSTDLLKSMKRLYDRESFLTIVQDLRAAVPQIGITTDIIVGFPGETESQFEETMSLVEEVRFDGAYMFIYSPRPGTPAADMEQLPTAVKKRRMLALVELHNRIAVERNEEWVGKTMEVLMEGPSPKDKSVLQGYSREFKMVHFPRPAADMQGEIVNVVGERARLWGLEGKLV